MFKLGDRVRWSSQAGGRVKEKVGVIVFIISKGEHVTPSLHAGYKIQFDGGYPREHESYLVSVKDGKTDKAKKSLYWPHVSKLKIVQ